MSDTKTMCIVLTRGIDDERSSVAWSISKGAVASGMKLIMFLTANGVEWARKGGFEKARPNPIDPPVWDMMQTVMGQGAEVYVCPPCAEVRGIGPEDLIDGAVIEGSGAIHRPILEGAATLCF
jgi:predicted peroxiredoxin